MFKCNLFRKGQASTSTTDLLLLVGPARALSLSRVLLSLLHPGLHHSSAQPVQLRRRTSAEHPVADSPSNPDSEEQFDPRAKPGAAMMCMQSRQGSPACSSVHTNSDMDATRKSSCAADPRPSSHELIYKASPGRGYGDICDAHSKPLSPCQRQSRLLSAKCQQKLRSFRDTRD